MKCLRLLALSAPFILSSFSNVATAGEINCVSGNASNVRTWTFDSAEECKLADGNINGSDDIEAFGGNYDLGLNYWTKNNDISPSDTSFWLDINVTNGVFADGKNVTAEWTLADGFWDTYASAVFTVHVGRGGGGLKSGVAFLVSHGEYSGTWSYVHTGRGGGGGLSNVAIWYGGTAPTTPPPVTASEPGVLLMFGMGLLGLGLVRNRKFRI